MKTEKYQDINFLEETRAASGWKITKKRCKISIKKENFLNIKFFVYGIQI